MSAQFSHAILNKHIAPGVSDFVTADIPDMSTWAKESQHWIANFFLNSAFTACFAPPMNAYAFNFLRRAQFAFDEHHLARKATLAFLTSTRQSISVSKYCEALHHWEVFLGQSWHSYHLLMKAFDGNAFEKGDGSTEQRLHHFYNTMKHVESKIENGQMCSGATVPVWLTNRGLRSVDADLTYEETADVLKQLAVWADALMNPKTAKEAFAKLDT